LGFQFHFGDFYCHDAELFRDERQSKQLAEVSGYSTLYPPKSQLHFVSGWVTDKSVRWPHAHIDLNSCRLDD
jgi:hypothetical protein